MIYDYLCPNCDVMTASVKSLQDYDSPEHCSICSSEMMKVFNAVNIFAKKTDWPEYNPAFGKIIRNRSHRAEEAKINGWIEIGNEDTDKIAAKLAKDKAESWERTWSDEDSHLQGVG